jgi:hypothetical protein
MGNPGTNNSNWNEWAIATGDPMYSIDAEWFEPLAPPNAGFVLPVEAAYFKGSFTPWNGTDDGTATRIFVGDTLKSTEERAHLSSPEYFRYIDGLQPFTANEVSVGVSIGYQGGGNFSIESATVTMSIVTTA